MPPQGVTFERLAGELMEMFPKSQVTASKAPATHIAIPVLGNVARDYYHWEADSSPLTHLGDAYFTYRQSIKITQRLSERITSWADSHRNLVIALEIVTGAFLVQLIEPALYADALLRLVDVRLLYIVLIATAYGTLPGTIAAVLMCFSLAASYATSGLDVVSLFYMFENWLPFLLYLALGGMVGYTHTKQEEDNKFLQDTIDRTNMRLEYVESLYQDSLRIKNSYRSQLIQSKNGFGKIYDVVQRLSVFEPSEIFLQSIPVIQDVLDCKSVALYSINPKSPSFARLQVCSEELSRTAPTTLDLAKFPQVTSALATDDAWFNQSFDPDLPDYIGCVRNEGQIRMLITLDNVTFEQMNTYYMNLLRIMARLMENFLVKAWEYESAQADMDFYEGTIIMRPARLDEKLAYCRNLAEHRLGTYRLLRIHTHGETLEELNHAFEQQVRNSDFLGMGTDGNLYLLALQVNDSNEHFLLNRFRSLGWQCEFVRDE